VFEAKIFLIQLLFPLFWQGNDEKYGIQAMVNVKLNNITIRCDDDDFKNIFFVSSHCFEVEGTSHFYPGSGSNFSKIF